MTPFDNATFDTILRHIHEGADPFDAPTREGFTFADMMTWIVATRSAGGPDHHPSVYLARASYLERHALRLADELANYAQTKRMRAGTVAAEWRAVIDRLMSRRDIGAT